MAAHGSGVAGVHRFWPSGVKTTRIWIREDLRIMREPPVASARLGVAQERGCVGGSGSGCWEPTGVGCSGRASAGFSVQKGQGTRARRDTPDDVLCGVDRAV